MKTLLLIISLLNIYLYSQPVIESENINEYYSVSSLYMNVLKLREGELVLYGGDGGVLRTYDNGQTWNQSYSGTKTYIPKMRFNNNNVYGVTQDGRFMKSTDKGDFWKYQTLSNGFNDLIIHKNSIYISTFSDSIFVSSDDGNTWKKYKMNIDSILNISSFEEYIIINTKTGKIFYTDDINSELIELEKPLTSFYVNNKYSGFYIYSNSQIAELKSDLTWNLYDLSSLNRRFKFIPEDNQFKIFSASRKTRSELGLETYVFDKNTQELKFINKFRNELLNSNDQIYNQEYEPFDVELSNGVYFSSNYYKTILTTRNLINWDININCNITGNVPKYIFDDKNIAVLKSGKAEIVRSSNGGKTFKINQNIPYDTIDGKELVPKANDIFMVDKDNALIYLNNVGDFHSGATAAFSKKFIEIKDCEYKSLDLDLRYSVETGYIDDIFITNNTFGKYIIELRNKSKKIIPDENGKYLDSSYFYKYYAYKDNELDTLFSLTKQIIFHNNISSINTIYFTGNLEVEDSTKNGKTILYSMNDAFKNIKIENEFGYDIGHYDIHKDINNNYIVLNNSDIYMYDKEFSLIRKIETEYDGIEIIGNLTTVKNTYFRFGRPYSDTINGIIINKFKSFRFYFDENYIPIEVENDNEVYIFKESMFNKSFKYNIEFRGLFNALVVPIEPDRLEYYTSVEEFTPPSIWTYPPYPNPVKDRLKMKFYSAIMGQIGNLKVELIEIGSGRVYNINDYKISTTDDYFGEIDINISNYNSGAYLINFKLGESNKSESIIIE